MMDPVMRFPATWDRTLRVSTWVGSIVLVATPVVLLSRALPDQGGAASAFRAMVAAILLILPIAWAFAPKGFAIEGAALRVERPVLAPEIPLSAIRRVSFLPADARYTVLRVFGTSGLFGYYGRFWSRRLGSFRMYATRRRGLVLVETEAARYVLSPDPPERFVEALLARAPRARVGNAPAQAGGATSSRAAWLVPLLGVLAVAIAILAVLLGALGYAPTSIAVAGADIRIERRWAGPIDIPLSTVRAGETLPAGACRGWVRTNGVAGLGSVAYGEYRSPALGRFRLYAFRPGPFVRVDTTDGPLVLTPDDPGRFLSEVRAGMRPDR
jgi:hypothetical protein